MHACIFKQHDYLPPSCFVYEPDRLFFVDKDGGRKNKMKFDAE